MVNWVLRKQMKYYKVLPMKTDVPVYSVLHPHARGFFTFALPLTPHLPPLFSALPLAPWGRLAGSLQLLCPSPLPMGSAHGRPWKEIRGSRGENVVSFFPDSSCVATVFL